jgi:uncharacterized lipoprotein YddW (UPF0748 family)
MKKYLLFILLLSSFLLAQRPQEFRAVKLTNVDSNVLFTDQNIAAAMDYLASINVNVILPVVWNGCIHAVSKCSDGQYLRREDPSAVRGT